MCVSYHGRLLERQTQQETCTCLQVRAALRKLVLRNEDVVAWEHERRKKDGQVKAPWPIKFTYDALCFSLDILYKNRPIQR